MNIKSLSPEVRQIWRVVKIVQMTWGFSFGLYIFTYGPYLYEKFGGAVNASTAMILTTTWFAVGLALEALLEVPTGAIGDAIGRKKTVLWSLTFRVVYFLFLALVSITNSVPVCFALAIIANIAFAFSYTFFSGTFTAWWVDSLRKIAPDLGYEHISARGYTYGFIARILGGVVGVLCYTNDIAYAAYLLGAFVCVPCFTICSAEMEESYSQFLSAKTVNLAIITRRIGEIIGLGFQTFKNSTPILCLTLLFASYMFLMNIVDYLWPVALHANISPDKHNLYWIGLVVLFLVSSTFGSKMVGWLSKSWSNKQQNLKTHNRALRLWLVSSCLSCGIPVILLGWFMAAWGEIQFPLFVAAIILIQFAYGMILPCYETLVNNYIPDASSDERATILSFGSLLRSVMVALLGIPSGGKSAETTTIGWMIPAVLLVGVAIVSHFVLSKKERALAAAENGWTAKTQ